MAVHRQDGVPDAGHSLLQDADDARELRGHGVADRVGNVDGRGAGLDRGGDHPAEKVEVAAGGVLGRELDVARERAGQTHRFDRHVEDFAARPAQLVLDVQVGGGDESVEAGPRGRLDGPPGALDVVPGRARQGGDHRSPHFAGHGVHRPEVVLGGDRETRLDDVHPQRIELPGHPELLFQIHAAAGRLLAVAQRRVEDDDPL